MSDTMTAQRNNTCNNINLQWHWARRGMLTTELALEELGLDQGDFDADEPMMAGSDEEFSDFEDDVCLEDVEDDDEDDIRVCHSPLHPPPSDTLGSSFDNPLPGSSSDTLPCWTSTLTSVSMPPFDSPVGQHPQVSIWHCWAALYPCFASWHCWAEQSVCQGGDGWRKVQLMGKSYKRRAKGLPWLLYLDGHQPSSRTRRLLVQRSNVSLLPDSR